MGRNTMADALPDEPPAAVPPLTDAWSALRSAYRADEEDSVARLRAVTTITPEQNARIGQRAIELAAGIRERVQDSFNAEAFLGRYGLSTREGVVLMCLAEAFLRIPDERTTDELLRDKLSGADWSAHDDGGSLLLNASTWGLMLSGKVAGWQEEQDATPWSLLKNLVARVGEPLLRAAIKHAMRIMAEQFVAGETMAQALERSAGDTRYTYSFDMLGEAARTGADAERYFASYTAAIEAAGAASSSGDLHVRPGISVKLSALHARYEVVQKSRVMQELLPRLRDLVLLARSHNVSLTIDAEEAERLTLSLELFEHVLRDPALAHWNGFGLAVQAYQKRAYYVIAWLRALTAALGRQIMVRWSKVRTGILKSSSRSSAECPTTLSIRARPQPICLTSPASNNCSRPEMRFIRSSPRTTAARSLPCSSLRSTAAASSSKSFTGWAMRSTSRCWRRTPRSSAAFMRRWGAIRTCCPISCGAYWRTAPTARSCIRLATRTSH
jgi:proline dehydrogenase